MPTFIDLFAGCGGLSLGLTEAGWTGRFAIERHPDAFATLHDNLLTGSGKRFSWPRWLKKKAWSIQDLLSSHEAELAAMRGKVDLIAGGPPCQGYSTAGRRNPKDTRNRLVDQYLHLVSIVRPRYLMLENVVGFTAGFLDKQADGTSSRGKAASDVLRESLIKLGYQVSSGLLNCADWGVPQRRMRFIALAVHESAQSNTTQSDLLEVLNKGREGFLKSRGLPTSRAVTASEALDDLRTSSTELQSDPEFPRFSCIQYSSQKQAAPYLARMRKGMGNAAPNSLRLPQHRPPTVERFVKILAQSTPGRTLSLQDRAVYGLKKHTFIPLARDKPSPTVTTLPDDMLHYAEPRILTVREMARLQSFPDWFEFRGKYTTGGQQRVKDCPRYSQVGNAVPPLVGEALGHTLLSMIRAKKARHSRRTP